MKIRLTHILMLCLSGLFMLSCSKSIEKKISGTWKVEDVSFESGSSVDTALLDASEQSQKAVSYELLEDHTAKIRVGSTILEGSWIYKDSDDCIYMVFSGSYDTILLGKYENGKLVNVDTNEDLKITTIFIKEEE